MLDSTTKRRIDDCRDILVGKVPDPKSQIDQITVALIYKFMHDMDQEAVELGGTATFFAGTYAQYAWPNLMAKELGGEDRVKLYAEALEKMPENPGLPPLFRDIFKNTFLPYRDPATLREFLKRIDEFIYDHSEKLGDAFEYLLSIMGSQGDAGQFRTPRHLIDFMTAVIDPQKHETILDPACGTAGFLISAYKHILRYNSSNHAADDPLAFQLHGVKQEDLTVSAKKYSGDKLTPDDRKRLVKNLVGYDIDPGMVKLSLVNLYLHGFPEPHINEYDTLTSTDRWEERFDVVLANPPFMSPKGGIQPHSKFGIPSTRSEVLFVDYIAEHLNPNGRALVVVPEGIIFQSGKAYKALRKKLVDEHYLVGVVSLPGGVFNPYSGVKTSLLWFDRALARRTDKLLFVKIEHDGFDLGAQRRPVAQNDLPEAFRLMMEYKRALVKGVGWETLEGWEAKAVEVERETIAKNGEYSLSGDRYQTNQKVSGEYPMVPLAELIEVLDKFRKPITKADRVEGPYPYYGATGILDHVHEYIFEEQLVLLGEDGAKWGANEQSAFIATGKYWVNNHAHVVRPKRERLMDRYLVEVLNQMDLSEYITGITVPKLTQGKMLEIQIPLPPLSEQEALVAEVEGYQRVIDGARQVVAHYKPRITIDPQWEMVELGEVCDLYQPKTITGSDILEDGPYKVFGANGVIGFFTEYNHEEPEVLITCRGATCGTINMSEAKSWVTGNAMVAKPKDDRLIKEYLLFALLGSDLRPTITGSAQPQITRQSLSPFKIPLPPLPEQVRIVAALEEERRMVEAARALAARMEERVRDRVARVWSPSRCASATEGHSGSDDQMISRSDASAEAVAQVDGGMPVRETSVEGENEGSDEVPELAMAAEPVPAYSGTQAVAQHRPSILQKGNAPEVSKTEHSQVVEPEISTALGPEEVEDWLTHTDMEVGIRRTFRPGMRMDRETALRALAVAKGHKRLGKYIKEEMEVLMDELLYNGLLVEDESGIGLPGGVSNRTAKRGTGRPPKGDAPDREGAAQALLGYLHAHPGWHGKAAILEATGVDAGAWNAAIKELLEAGKVERQGEKKGARYRGR